MTLFEIRNFLFGIPLCALSSWAIAQSGSAQVVIAPSVPTSTDAIRVSAPVELCYTNEPNTVLVDSAFLVTGNVVTLTVNTKWNYTCFFAGDPPVFKPVVHALGALPPGSYSLEYKLINLGTQTYAETVAFTVAPVLPTSSRLVLALTALLLLSAAIHHRCRRAA